MEYDPPSEPRWRGIAQANRPSPFAGPWLEPWISAGGVVTTHAMEIRFAIRLIRFNKG